MDYKFFFSRLFLDTYIRIRKKDVKAKVEHLVREIARVLPVAVKQEQGEALPLFDVVVLDIRHGYLMLYSYRTTLCAGTERFAFSFSLRVWTRMTSGRSMVFASVLWSGARA